MKAKSLTGSSRSFSSDICANQYSPSTSPLLSKVQNKTSQETLFEKNKNQLITNSNIAAKSTSLLNKKILVVINNNCSSGDGTLSTQVLSQNPDQQKELLHRQTYTYLIDQDISFEELTALVDTDPCVIGIADDGLMTTSSLPINDPKISQQTHFNNDYSHIYKHLILEQNTAQKVKVGVLDTGADCTHADLLGNIVGGCGFDAVDGLMPVDDNGHGSHTMGMIGAVMNNGIGVSGMAGNAVELHAIKVLSNGSGSVQDSYDGIQYAIQNNFDVLNVSLESQTRLALIEQGVQEAVAAGIVVVMAAGNHGQQLGTTVDVSPALVGDSLLGAITVGSVDVVDSQRSNFSNFGSKVEIYAMGAFNSNLDGNSVGGLLSLDLNGGYQNLMGTSQATPIISAAASLAIQFLKQRNITYTPADIEQIILASTDPGIDTSGGGGLLNEGKFVRTLYSFAGLSLCSGD